MRKTVVFAIMLIISLSLNAQTYQAFLQEDHTISVEKTIENGPLLIFRGNTFSQMTGFPKSATANKTFKNFRNVTLADIDGDQIQDIVWGADNQLFAHSFEKMLWNKTLSGTAIYPPTVANIDNEGGLEIVQSTGGSQTNSRIYLLNDKGEDLPGWPLNFNGHWILTAPTLSDLNNDQQLEIIFNERDIPNGRMHVVTADGQPFSSDWPVTIPGTPAVTPSVGDVDQDDEKEIYISSTTTRYLYKLNGEIEEGWPQLTDPKQKYSFQSPLMVDFDQDGTLEIVGATHGDSSQYYILRGDGSYYPGWPKSVPGNVWTFNTPTVVSIDDELKIFMSRPIGELASDMLYSWDADGNLQSGFPLFKPGGLEGLISIVDVDGDDDFELLFGSNLLTGDGNSFIHAYELDGSTVVSGFPLLVKGWTFMNGINAGDVNGDGMMDLVALTYTQNFQPSPADSVLLNVFELKVPYSPDRVLWSTYKGSNTRDGLLKQNEITPLKELKTQANFELSIYPNPSKSVLNLQVNIKKRANLQLQLINSQGQVLKTLYDDRLESGDYNWSHYVDHLPPGMYSLLARFDHQIIKSIKFVKMND